MHIARQDLRQMVVRIYPSISWTMAVIFVAIALIALFSHEIGFALLFIGFALLLNIMAEIKTYVFDRDRQQLTIHRWRYWRKRKDEYALNRLAAVALAYSRSSDGDSNVSRIELVYDSGQVLPLTNYYSSTEKRNITIAIANFLNVEARVPPSLGEVVKEAFNLFADLFFHGGRSSRSNRANQRNNNHYDDR
jgi:hypothetical protein